MEKFGIDVAKWQGNIDWSKVKKSGIYFAILKVTQKNNAVEGAFERNYSGASENGLDIGVYRYVYAKTVAQAQAEANAIVKNLQGKSITYGVWLDMEDASIKGIGKAMLTSIIRAEAVILNKAGYYVGIYCNKDWYDNVLDSKNLKAHYPFWIARYPLSDKGVYNASSTLSPKSYGVMWQYSSKGKVDGISGNVDLDVAFSDLKELMKCDTGVKEPDEDEYYPKYVGSTTSIVMALAAVGEKDTSISNRQKIGAKNGIPNIGKVSGNSQMLLVLKAGNLKKA